MTNDERRLAGLAAMVLGPMIYLGMRWFSYWPDRYPGPFDTKSWALFAAAVLVSTAGLYVRGRQRKWFLTGAVLLVYSAVLTIVLIFADGAVACMNGDCF